MNSTNAGITTVTAGLAAEQLRAVNVEASLAAAGASDKARALAVEASIASSVAAATTGLSAALAQSLAANAALQQQLTNVLNCSILGKFVGADGRCVSAGSTGSSSAGTATNGGSCLAGNTTKISTACLPGFSPLSSQVSVCDSSASTIGCSGLCCDAN